MSDQAASFRTKALNSAKLAGIRYASDVALRVISTVVLTRLLAPEVYGIFAVVMIYLYILEMFSDFGLRSLILTKEGEVEDDFLRTCWTVSILRGLLIAVFSILIAVVIALLQEQNIFADDNPYSAAVLPWAIAALGLASLLMGFESPMRCMSEREMAFGRVTFADVTRNIVGLVVTIVLAYYLRSVWALVLGNFARALTHVALSFLMFRGPPMRFCLNRSYFKLLIARGKWIASHSALTALSLSADRLILGFVMTSSSFGFYFIARQLVDLVAQLMSTLSSQMALQMFIYLQRSTIENFRRNYYRYRLFYDALGGLSAGGLIVLSPLLVEIVFDDRYADVAPIAQILAMGLLVYGQLLLRDAYGAERRFKELTFLGTISAMTLWIGLALAVALFEPMPASILVIALHRVPEAIAVTAMGWKRGWVILWRETFSLVFCGVGGVAGLAVLSLWTMLA